MATVPLMFAQEDVEFGGKASIINDFAYNNNVMQATTYVRMGFLRKVYGLLSVQLLISVVVSGICMFIPAVRNFIHANHWLMSCALVLSIIVLIALHVKRRDSPANFILLAAFTVIQAYTIGVVLTYYDQVVVLQALFLTVTVVIGLSLYTFQSKRDFSSLGFGWSHVKPVAFSCCEDLSSYKGC
ncbi:hypothetical protein Cfor_03281 [Coptotermes formosanus]|uniref:Uncharacterized protein n=1 Tax=Coptotermes formosanus TaxID=36987 RepID=A0A6L2PBB9_COPFO|nr:hypothetical protein Cfor_03281 [Coptotermes formosanus]